MMRNTLAGLSVLAAIVACAWGGWFLTLGTAPAALTNLGKALHSEATSNGAGTSNEPLLPIGVAIKAGADPRVELGRALFNDPRLSVDDSISCASCHQVSQGGADKTALSRGVGGKLGSVNAPSVNYAGLNFRQFWDGRAPTLEAQVDGPVHHPKEMGSEWPQIIRKLSQDENFTTRFLSAYPAGLKAETIRDAIARYERSLSLPSRFDRWLLGDKGALSAEEVAGYSLFKHHGCTACHQGVGVGGNLFQKFGIVENPLARKASMQPADLGRFNVTGRSEDSFVFKVPGLRNVALTAPYFHDGSAATLEEAVSTMGRAQLGLRLSSREVELLVLFLGTLTAEELP